MKQYFLLSLLGGNKTMKTNLLKLITLLAIATPCLVGCDNIKEGELVTAECIFNGYEKLPDFSTPFVINTKDYKDLVVSAHGDYFYINDFKIYDSLYLADVNGDGRRDFCTEFMYTSGSRDYHGYAFYDIKKKEYIKYFCPTNKMSYYLGEKDGALIVKEFYGEHNASDYKKGKGHRRTATLLTGKEPTFVWKDEPFKLIKWGTSFGYSDEQGVAHSTTFDGGSSGIEATYGADTNREFYLLFHYFEFNGIMKEEDFNISFNENPAYKIEFDAEESDLPSDLYPQHAYVYYNITFFEEGRFDIVAKMQDVEEIIPITVDTARFNQYRQ